MPIYKRKHKALNSSYSWKVSRSRRSLHLPEENAATKRLRATLHNHQCISDFVPMVDYTYAQSAVLVRFGMQPFQSLGLSYTLHSSTGLH